jgi:hypothetical protein
MKGRISIHGWRNFRVLEERNSRVAKAYAAAGGRSRFYLAVKVVPVRGTFADTNFAFEFTFFASDWRGQQDIVVFEKVWKEYREEN